MRTVVLLTAVLLSLPAIAQEAADLTRIDQLTWMIAAADPALRDLAWQELIEDGRPIADKRVRTEMLRLVQDDRTSAASA